MSLKNDRIKLKSNSSDEVRKFAITVPMIARRRTKNVLLLMVKQGLMFVIIVETVVY